MAHSKASHIVSPNSRGRRICLVILGMHRSGTSLLAGVLGLLGASLPKHMFPPNFANPKGYFEPQKIVGLHDDMLSAMKSSWIDFRHLDLSRLAPTATAEFKETLAAAVNDEYGDSPKFVVKDPRICRFFPLWREVADTVGAEARVIIVIRNPIEVARSL